MKTLKHVSTEMSLHVLVYNLKRMMRMIVAAPLMEAMKSRERNRSFYTVFASSGHTIYLEFTAIPAWAIRRSRLGTAEYRYSYTNL